MNEHKHTNRLAKESSPYLLQHAHNPVDWYPWGEEALQKAKSEEKLMLISVGYAACHWCHVMEKESFEDTVVAEVMNKHFVCIKVDREERPDVDQVYMNAAQLLTGRGGWPLNAFALPDGRPIYAGTYFPKQQWLQTLQGIQQVYIEDYQRVERAAQELQSGIANAELIREKADPGKFTPTDADAVVAPWKEQFDVYWGGTGLAPKFPLPNSLQFLLDYVFYRDDKDVEKQLLLTLDKMAHGGIYDQIGGGFARYSVDEYWKVPHFEKMLYDNGQLLSLYSNAYQFYGKRLYKETVFESIAFVERELTSFEGGFYSSLDADSEGEEGKFYVFKRNDFTKLLGDSDGVLSEFYNITDEGNWEHGNNIPFITEEEADFAKRHDLTEDALFEKLQNFKKKAYSEREKRIRPGLDDKILVSWNALMLKGLVDAYKVFREAGFLNLALRNADFIVGKMMDADFHLFRNYKNGNATINAFLDDYAFTIDAFIALYQQTFDEKWLNTAKQLTDYTLTHFYDEQSGMFFFTSDLDSVIVARKMELSDGVLPASNSQMALNLHHLGLLFHDASYSEKAKQMLANVAEQMPQAGAYFSNWANLLNKIVFPTFEVAILGEKANEWCAELHKKYRPDLLFAGAGQESGLPILTERFVTGENRIYVCQDRACKLPSKSPEEAKKLLVR